MSSPTKRRLKMIKNKLYSLEDDKKGVKSKLNENNGLDNQNQFNSKNEKVKFMDSLDELENKEKEDEGNDDVRLLRQILKSRKQPIQQFRHFSVDQDGQRIIDSGVRTIRSKIHQNPPQTIKNINPKARRATCPEIWLSEAEDEERLIMNCAVRLFGCNSVGKKSIAKQLASAAEICPQDDGIVSTDCEDVQRPYRTVSFLLNEHEVNMQIIQGSLLPQNQISDTIEEFTIFAVVYSVDNRESFILAAQILYRIYGDRKIAKRGNKKKTKENIFLPLILIANKSDLQRKRRINSIEGKMLAKIYKCPFVEMSSLLSANVDILWNEVIRKLYKYEKIVDHLIVEKQQKEVNEINELTTGLTIRPPLVGRIFERTRRFAKSCEDWITTKLILI
ncbi:hypothetical protein ACQ4LE_003984 [Meloidogyne hapla]